MSAPEVKVGDTVQYVAHVCHAMDKGIDNQHVFHWRHVKNGPSRNGEFSAVAGEIVNMQRIGSTDHSDGGKRDLETGHVSTAGGFTIAPVAPRKRWLATVLNVAPDGKLDLDIQHPHGHRLLYPAVPFSATGNLHSWSLEGA